MTRVLHLTLLTPDIVALILDGKQGQEVTPSPWLASLPLAWTPQALFFLCRKKTAFLRVDSPGGTTYIYVT